MDKENMTIMDELFSSRAKSSREKYDITIVDMCFERLSADIYPRFGNYNRALLDHFYQLSLATSIPQFFLDNYMDSDLGISDATDMLVENLIDAIRFELE